jgi:hypothetical protein
MHNRAWIARFDGKPVGYGDSTERALQSAEERLERIGIAFDSDSIAIEPALYQVSAGGIVLALAHSESDALALARAESQRRGLSRDPWTYDWQIVPDAEVLLARSRAERAAIECTLARIGGAP